MGKVIICAKLTGKLHLTSFSFSLSSIIIRLLIITIVLGFITIFPTLTSITSFLLIPSWLLVTIWVGRQLHRMYIRRLSGVGRHRRSWPSCRLVKRQIFHMACHRVCRLYIGDTYNAIGMRSRILSRVVS
jgi:hypothetical protein